MAITLQCPRCMKEQKIDDDRAGQEIPCRICHHPIKPPAATGKETTKPPAPKADGIQAGAPGKAPAFVGKKPMPPQDDEPRTSRKRGGREDDDDDERRPTARRRQPEQGASSMMGIMIAGGAFLALTFLCGGGTLTLYWLMDSKPLPPDNQVVEVDIQPAPFQPQPFQPQPFQPPPFQPPEVLDANNPNEIDRVFALLRGPAQQRGPALVWLSNADPNHPRRGEVARLLESMVNEMLPQPFANNTFFPAYFRWATSDNVPSLLRLAGNNAFTDNDRRQKAMVALGKMKEGRAAETIAARLPNIFDRNAAHDALREMGPIAEGAVLKYFNHPDGGAREAARRLLEGYGTKPGALLAQCVADVESGENNRRRGALQWLAQKPVDPAHRVEVARGLNKGLDDPNALRNGDLVKALETWGGVENVPKLIALLERPPFGSKEAVRILGKFRDPEGIKAVAHSMNNFFNAGEARMVLKELGSAAEPAVVEALATAKDRRAREDYIRLLGEIGTKNVGGTTLMNLRVNDAFLQNTINQSIQAINARGK